MKRILLSVTAMMLWAATAWAYDFSAEAPGGLMLYYNLKGKTVEVTSQLGDAPYYQVAPSGEVAIPLAVVYEGVSYPVASIAAHAFEGCREITKLTIGGSVTTIGKDAFKGCDGLLVLTLGSGLTSVGDGAFEGCDHVQTLYYNAQNCEFKSARADGAYGLRPMAGSVTKLMIGEGVRILPKQVFHGFVKVKEVVLPVSLNRIGDGAFYGCSALKKVNFGASISRIGDAAFCGCRALVEADLPPSLTAIGDRAFAHCTSLSSVTVGRSLATIGKAAFVGCSSLKSIVLPRTCLHIGEGAFASGTAVQKK